MKKLLTLGIVAVVFAMTMSLMGCNAHRNPVATIQTQHGSIVIELYYDVAPNTVRNFIYLANQGFYDGLIFHRVGETFMIQGGCPLGTGTGNPGHRIACELNSLHHGRGVLSMAHAGRNSGGSQFFIMTGEAPHLNGHHTAFGRVTQGLGIVDTIARQPGTPLGGGTYRPTIDQVMQTVTVNTFGRTFAAPTKI